MAENSTTQPNKRDLATAMRYHRDIEERKGITLAVSEGISAARMTATDIDAAFAELAERVEQMPLAEKKKAQRKIASVDNNLRKQIESLAALTA